MTRINTNNAALLAARNLQRNNMSLNTTLERLSTGFKINRASDGPASLVISERLRSQISSLNAAMVASERATSMVTTAEAALNEVSGLLVDVQDLIIEAANDGALSDEEITANQAQVDSAIETITRIAQTTSFAGLKLFNGNFEYSQSGLNGTHIRDYEIFGAGITNAVSNLAVNVQVTNNASQALVSVAQSGAPLSGMELLVQGGGGAELITLATSAQASAIVAAINATTSTTHVTALQSGGSIHFQSVEYGSDQFVSVRDLSNVANPWVEQRDEGRDITGSINGIAATGKGLRLTLNNFNLNLQLDLSANFYSQNAVNIGNGVSAASTSFRVTGGGATFQLGGGIEPRDQEFIGIKRLTADNLGLHGVGFLDDLITGGSASLLLDPESAHKIVNAAIDEISALRARLGAFVTHTLQTNINSLQVNVESIAASESRIRDTDFALESSALARNQILVQAATSVLAQANVRQQTVLQLLQ